MKKLLHLICAILSLCMLFSVVGCNSSSQKETDAPATDAPTDKPTEAPTDKPTDKPTEKPTEAPTEKPTEKPSRPVVSASYSLFDDWRLFKLCGRAYYANDGIICDHSASGIEFSGFMKGDVDIELECDRDTYFTVFVDGERVEERLFADKNTEFLTVANLGDEPAEHHIRILTQTESLQSLSLLKGVTIVGYLDDYQPDEKDFYIEFVGDSLTAAYGNIGKPGASNPGSALWQDGTQSYAVLACEELGADYTIAACSGVGIDKGWTAFSILDYYKNESYHRHMNVTHYDPRTPDIIVINLGTNDQDCGSSENGFKTKMIALIDYLRESYGENVPIIWAYNFGGYGCDSWAFDVIEQLGGEENEIYTFKMTYNNEGANGHPDLEAHYAAADELVSFIKDKKLLY